MPICTASCRALLIFSGLLGRVSTSLTALSIPAAFKTHVLPLVPTVTSVCPTLLEIMWASITFLALLLSLAL